MVDCHFCPLNPERNPIISENNGVVAMLSNPSLVPNHTLVLPRRHVSALWELTALEYVAFMSMAMYIQRAFVEQLGASGCDFSIHYRPFMRGTSAEAKLLAVPDHLHGHVKPRGPFDELWKKSQQFEDKLFRKLSPETVAEVTANMRVRLKL